jgi:hypothetical protein
MFVRRVLLGGALLLVAAVCGFVFDSLGAANAFEASFALQAGKGDEWLKSPVVVSRNARRSKCFVGVIVFGGAGTLVTLYALLGLYLDRRLGLAECGSCREWVKEEAKICRFCGKDVKRPRSVEA